MGFRRAIWYLLKKICIASATSKGKEQQGRAGSHLCGRGVGACRLGAMEAWPCSRKSMGHHRLGCGAGLQADTACWNARRASAPSRAKGGTTEGAEGRVRIIGVCC